MVLSDSILSKLNKRIKHDSLTEITVISTELGTTPVGGCTGDITGHTISVLAPWSCEDCPDPYSSVKEHGAEMFGMSTVNLANNWGSIWSNSYETIQWPIASWPTRCTDCDTRYKKHKRTTNAVWKIYHHPLRMERCGGGEWVFTHATTYREIKMITLTVPNRFVLPGNLEEQVLQILSELKEKFRRKRKLKLWKDQVAYGRWFAEATFKIHYQDGSVYPKGSKGMQYLPSEHELEGAVEVEVHPHLHTICVSKYWNKEALTEWWGNGSTDVRATKQWMAVKDYLTKYVNKQQVGGRQQGTFGRVTK